jgi:gamma-tubulin complex component 6
MKIVQEAFNHIHRFRAQLMSAKWHHKKHTFSNYSTLCATYTSFRKNTQLLFMIVTKLVERGYQPHLEDLLLRINYNGFFTQN